MADEKAKDGLLPSQEQQERTLQGSGCAGLIVFIVTICIYTSPDGGRSGVAYCSENLSGYLFVLAWVSLGQFCAPSFLAIASHCFPSCQKAIFLTNSATQVGANIFTFVWFIIGNMRLYSTQPCPHAPRPDCASPACDSGLWNAVHGFFIFQYVVLGLFVCCCCCFFGGMGATIAAGKQGRQPNEKTPLGEVA